MHFTAYRDNPDLIASTHHATAAFHAQQQQQHGGSHHASQHGGGGREYGTLGRMPREQPPPYQDFQQRPQDTYGHFINQSQPPQQQQQQHVELDQQQMEQQAEIGDETEQMYS